MGDDGRIGTGEATRADPAGWVDRHGDCLYRYALLKLGEPDRAADVVQETFLHALRSFESFSGRSSERTWLVGILKHKVVDQLRASARRQSLAETIAAERAVAPEFDRAGYWRARPGDWAGTVGQAVETQEFWDVVRSCLAHLPATLADAFLLRELDGLGADEVQSRLGITPANLWARLHRARLLLRRCLETHWFDPGTESATTSHSAPPSAHRKARPADGPTA